MQDWLNNRPATDVKALIREAMRVLGNDGSDEPQDEPQLMGRGLERC